LKLKTGRRDLIARLTIYKLNPAVSGDINVHKITGILKMIIIYGNLNNLI